MAGHGAPHGGNPGHGREHYYDRPWSRDEAVELLEAPERVESLDPVAFWKRAGLTPGATVVDVGSGTGYFAVPAARAVGFAGHVYAVDISRELVDYITGRAREDHLPQLAAVESSTNTIPLPSGIADVVLLATVLHDISSATVSEAIRLMRPSGRLIDVDWRKNAGPDGPPEVLRLSPEEATGLLSRHGLTVVDSWEPGPSHYALALARSMGGPGPAAGTIGRGRAR